MWKSPQIVFLVSAAALGLAALLLAQARSDYPAYQIRTVSTMTSATRSPSQGAPTIARLFFGRKDGSHGVRTTEVINGRPCTSTTYWNAETHEKVTASDCVAMKSSEPFTSAPRLGRVGAPVSTCSAFISGPRLAGTETIQGLKVERFEASNATERSTVYLAPELGCLTVRGLHYWKGLAGKITSTTFDEPVEIKTTPPDGALFETPPNYREVLPSERRNALDEYFTGTSQAAACLQGGNAREDKRYLEARKAGKPRGLSALLARLRP